MHMPAAATVAARGSAFPQQRLRCGKETGAKPRLFFTAAEWDFSRLPARRDSPSYGALGGATARTRHYGLSWPINQTTTKKIKRHVDRIQLTNSGVPKDSAQLEHVVSAPAAALRWWISACHCGAPTGKHNYNSFISTILSIAPHPSEARR